VTSGIHDPDGPYGRTVAQPAQPAGEPLPYYEPDERWSAQPRPGAYWTGVVVLTAGLAVTVLALATRVTSIVQTVLIAVPLALVGIGLERVGRGVGRASLRSVGAIALVIAVVGPVALSLTSPNPAVIARPSAAVPAGATSALLRATLGGGQLRIDPEASGLYTAELRGQGQPSHQVTTDGKLAVLDLRAPVQRGLLARNRGSDWAVRLTTALAWRVEVEAGTITADLNLRQLDVRGVRVEGGVTRVAVRLGEPAADVPVDLQVSSGLVDLYLPRTAACEIRVDGVSIDNFGDQGLVKQGEVWRTNDAPRSGRYVIRVKLSGGRVQLHRE
jgi:hypothetical protein